MRTKRTDKRRTRLLAAIAAGKSVTAAADAAGICRRSVYDWRDSDPAFARDMDAAYQAGTDRLYDAAMERALLPDHDGLLIYLLKQRDPWRFGQKMVEVVRVHDTAPVIDGIATDADVVRFVMPDNGRRSPELIESDTDAADDSDPADTAAA
jgi:hypothetical protein